MYVYLTIEMIIVYTHTRPHVSLLQLNACDVFCFSILLHADGAAVAADTADAKLMLSWCWADVTEWLIESTSYIGLLWNPLLNPVELRVYAL